MVCGASVASRTDPALNPFVCALARLFATTSIVVAAAFIPDSAVCITPESPISPSRSPLTAQTAAHKANSNLRQKPALGGLIPLARSASQHCRILAPHCSPPRLPKNGLQLAIPLQLAGKTVASCASVSRQLSALAIGARLQIC